MVIMVRLIIPTETERKKKKKKKNGETQELQQE